MRKLSPAYVLTSVVIGVVGGTACAATPAAVVARPGNASVASTATANRTTLTSPAPSAPSSTAPSTGSTGFTQPANATSTIDGSRSGTNMDSSAINVPIGSTSASAGLAAVGVNGTTPLGTPGLNPAASAGGFGNAPIINPGYAVPIPAEGASGVDNSAAAATYANAQVGQMQFNGSAGAAVDLEAARDSRNFDRAVNVVKRDRQRVGRNGQLLHSIAPRTNVDRSREMPDDGPSPSLTGANSALTRP